MTTCRSIKARQNRNDEKSFISHSSNLEMPIMPCYNTLVISKGTPKHDTSLTLSFHSTCRNANFIHHSLEITMTRQELETALDAGKLFAHMRNGKWWRLRRNGKTQTWKTRPTEFRIP